MNRDSMHHGAVTERDQPEKIILITGPNRSGRGGVANFYLHLLPQLHKVLAGEFVVDYVSIGSALRSKSIFRPLADQHKVVTRLRQLCNPMLIHVNPSLNRKCVIRDGLFVWHAKRRKLPAVVFFRGWSSRFEQRVGRWWLYFLRHTLFRADAIIVLGGIFEEKIRNWGYTGPIFRTTTVVDPRIMNSSCARRRSPGKLCSLLFMSRLEADKGIMDVLEALELLRQRNLIAHLTIAGEGSAQKEVYQWLNAHQDCATNISMPGHVDGPAKIGLFETHDIFVLPTIHGEGLPNAILEAMAAGMPIVTSNAGAISDVVHDNENGFIVQAKKPLELAAAIESLIKDRVLFQTISENNQRLAQDKFSIETVSTDIATVYRSVFRRSRDLQGS